MDKTQINQFYDHVLDERPEFLRQQKAFEQEQQKQLREQEMQQTIRDQEIQARIQQERERQIQAQIQDEHEKNTLLQQERERHMQEQIQEEREQNLLLQQMQAQLEKERQESENLRSQLMKERTTLDLQANMQEEEFLRLRRSGVVDDLRPTTIQSGRPPPPNDRKRLEDATIAFQRLQQDLGPKEGQILRSYTKDECMPVAGLQQLSPEARPRADLLRPSDVPYQPVQQAPNIGCDASALDASMPQHWVPPEHHPQEQQQRHEKQQQEQRSPWTEGLTFNAVMALADGFVNGEKGRSDHLEGIFSRSEQPTERRDKEVSKELSTPPALLQRQPEVEVQIIKLSENKHFELDQQLASECVNGGAQGGLQRLDNLHEELMKEYGEMMQKSSPTLSSNAPAADRYNRHYTIQVRLFAPEKYEKTCIHVCLSLCLCLCFPMIPVWCVYAIPVLESGL
jgi:hypothetical protein